MGDFMDNDKFINILDGIQKLYDAIIEKEKELAVLKYKLEIRTEWLKLMRNKG